MLLLAGVSRRPSAPPPNQQRDFSQHNFRVPTAKHSHKPSGQFIIFNDIKTLQS
jgi:hypothetical protein